MGICQCVANEFIPRGLSTCTLLFQTLKKRCSPFFWKKKERTLLENDSFLDNSRRPWPLDGVSVAVSLLCFDWVSGAGQHTYLHILDHFPFSFFDWVLVFTKILGFYWVSRAPQYTNTPTHLKSFPILFSHTSENHSDLQIWVIQPSSIILNTHNLCFTDLTIFFWIKWELFSFGYVATKGL